MFFHLYFMLSIEVDTFLAIKKICKLSAIMEKQMELKT